MSSTQSHLLIEDIREDRLILKNGSVVQILETTAVNFGLLFETEQVAIIDSFAGLLNSLSFPIQIVVQSRRLDVSSYLHTLDAAHLRQTNPRLSELTAHYRSFVESLIKEGEVLDKRFFIVICAFGLELGVLPKSQADRALAAAPILKPRVDHLTRQMSRIGLRGRILTSVELVKLFYAIYNDKAMETVMPITSNYSRGVTPERAPGAAPAANTWSEDGRRETEAAGPRASTTPPHINTAPVAVPNILYQPQPPTSSPQSLVSSSHVPFVVEELPES